LMVSNCNGERSFSKMKLIKNRIRTSMTQWRLLGFALLSIKSNILRSLDFSQLIEKFATAKSRKVIIWIYYYKNYYLSSVHILCWLIVHIII
jgi:hypothetical protein